MATAMDAEGHKVTVLDVEPYSFRKLPSTFKGTALIGNGLDQDTLRKAGIDKADVFVTATQGDNRNVMAAQIAQHIFNVPMAVCRIYDPIREEMYRTLGLVTISPTMVGAELLQRAIEGQIESQAIEGQGG